MRIAPIAVAAIVGAVAGFAASQFSKPAEDAAGAQAQIDAQIDARLDSRLEALGLAEKDRLDWRIAEGVEAYLADKPESVYAALERHQLNEQRREEEERRQAVADLGDALTGQKNDPAMGASAAEADVTLVEFFDYRCGYCKRALAGVMALVEDDPKLRVVMKEFPILGPESVAATRVSLAANLVDPSRYMAFHVALMQHRGSYDSATLLGLAAEHGYDPAKVQEAMGNDAVTAQIRNGYEVAEALGIRGTPAFIVGDTIIPGAVGKDRLKEAIEAARAAKKG